MVYPSWQYDQIIRFNLDSDPFIFLITNVKVPTPFHDVTNFLVRMEVFSKEILQLKTKNKSFLISERVSEWSFFYSFNFSVYAFKSISLCVPKYNVCVLMSQFSPTLKQQSTGTNVDMLIHSEVWFYILCFTHVL
jgi:hypothetical protein